MQFTILMVHHCSVVPWKSKLLRVIEKLLLRCDTVAVAHQDVVVEVTPEVVLVRAVHVGVPLIVIVRSVEIVIVDMTTILVLAVADVRDLLAFRAANQHPQHRDHEVGVSAQNKDL